MKKFSFRAAFRTSPTCSKMLGFDQSTPLTCVKEQDISLSVHGQTEKQCILCVFMDECLFYTVHKSSHLCFLYAHDNLYFWLLVILLVVMDMVLSLDFGFGLGTLSILGFVLGKYGFGICLQWLFIRYSTTY